MRVLMIDDNPLDIELVSRVLQKRSQVALESVHTAEEGLRRLSVEDFDVVLLDYCLPGLNGLDFLKELQTRESLIPVLLITARGDDKIQEVARQAGAVDYISKDDSFTPALPRAIEAAAERGRAIRAVRERDRADEMRHSAEKLLSELELKVDHLESSLGASITSLQEPRLNTLPIEQRNRVIYRLTDRYEDILVRWLGTPAEAQKAREALSSLIAELLGLGFSAEQLVSLHTASLHRLRDHQRELHSQSGCSPRMLLLEASLALLDGYRRAALSAHVA